MPIWPFSSSSEKTEPTVVAAAVPAVKQDANQTNPKPVTMSASISAPVVSAPVPTPAPQIPTGSADSAEEPEFVEVETKAVVAMQAAVASKIKMADASSAVNSVFISPITAFQQFLNSALNSGIIYNGINGEAKRTPSIKAMLIDLEIKERQLKIAAGEMSPLFSPQSLKHEPREKAATKSSMWEQIYPNVFFQNLIDEMKRDMEPAYAEVTRLNRLKPSDLIKPENQRAFCQNSQMLLNRLQLFINTLHEQFGYDKTAEHLVVGWINRVASTIFMSGIVEVQQLDLLLNNYFIHEQISQTEKFIIKITEELLALGKKIEKTMKDVAQNHQASTQATRGLASLSSSMSGSRLYQRRAELCNNADAAGNTRENLAPVPLAAAPQLTR